MIGGSWTIHNFELGTQYLTYGGHSKNIVNYTFGNNHYEDDVKIVEADETAQ